MDTMSKHDGIKSRKLWVVAVSFLTATILLITKHISEESWVTFSMAVVIAYLTANGVEKTINHFKPAIPSTQIKITNPPV